MKGLTPSQLFDSLVAATGHREPGFMRQNQFNFNPQPNNPRSQFLNRFASNEKATEASTTILQALMLMNGQFITDVTSLEKGEVLGAIVDVPGWDTKQRITALFLTTLRPQPDARGVGEVHQLRRSRRHDRQQARRPWPTCSGCC